MTTDQAIAAVIWRGLRVNNLFQIGDHWRANVTDETKFWEFAGGATPVEAILAALAKVPVAPVEDIFA